MKIRFRNCMLDTVERTVVKDQTQLEIQCKAFDLLQYLVQHPGRIVTKDELLGYVWNGKFIEECSLFVHVSKLRKALGETKTERYIETAYCDGHRFVAPVVTNDVVSRLDVAELAVTLEEGAAADIWFESFDNSPEELGLMSQVENTQKAMLDAAEILRGLHVN